MNEDTRVKKSADRLKPNEIIVIDTYFFPKGRKGSRIYDEDAIVFTSEPLMVIDVNETTLKVKDEQGQVIYIPLEDYTTHDGQVHQQVRSPVKGLDFFIWVLYESDGESREKLRLQEIALEIVGETNISSLLRYIAGRGILVREPNQTRLRVAGVKKPDGG